MQNRLRQIQTDFFQELSRRGRSANTIKNYKTDLECFNQYLLQLNSLFDLQHFTLKEINGYGQFLETRYNSDNSRRRRVQTLRIFFDFLMEKGIITTNPVRELGTSPKFLDIPRPAQLIDIKCLWTHLLLAEKEAKGLELLTLLRNQLLLGLIFGAGLTVSDLSNLAASSVFDSKDGPRVLINRERRDPYSIPIPKIIYEISRRYLLLLEENKRLFGLEFTQLLFNANPHRILSGGLSPRGIELILEEFRELLKINVTPKNVRQACIFCWMTEGKRDGQIKEWLGLAPSYGLKHYRNFQREYLYTNQFLEDLHRSYLRLN